LFKEAFMSERVKWIEHKGKKILLCTLAGLEEPAYLEGVDEMEAALLKCAPGAVWPHIVDVTDSIMTTATSDRGKKTVDLLVQAGVRTRTAMVGVSGIKRVIAQAISKDVYFAKTMDDARDYVVAT
jgi:hypothetical protein